MKILSWTIHLCFFLMASPGEAGLPRPDHRRGNTDKHDSVAAAKLRQLPLTCKRRYYPLSCSLITTYL